MSKNIAISPWRLMGVMTVAMAIAFSAGCAKKEEAATTEETPMTEEPAVTPAAPTAAGTYMAELPAADTPGRKVTLMLNADMTASMSVDYMNDQPAMVENGTWAMGADPSMVDVTVQKDVSGAMMSATMSFTMSGETLTLANAEAAGFGAAGLTLTRQAAVEPGHEGHSH